MIASTSLASNCRKSLYSFGFSTPMLFFACSIFSSKTSQSATTRAGVFFAIIVDTKVPRLPVPITPTVIAEFAGVPRARPAAATEAPIMFRRDNRFMISIATFIGQFARGSQQRFLQQQFVIVGMFQRLTRLDRPRQFFEIAHKPRLRRKRDVLPARFVRTLRFAHVHPHPRRIRFGVQDEAAIGAQDFK